MELKRIIGLIFLLSFSTYAQEIVLSNKSDEIPVNDNCLMFEDANKTFSEHDILSYIFQKNFQKSTLSIPNFGYGNSDIWLKINLKNSSSKHWFLEIDNPRINDLSFFLINNNRVIYKTQTGDSQLFSSYQVADRNLFFDLKMLQNESYTIYLKANGSEDLKFPMTFWEERRLYQHLANRNLIWGIYFGFIFLISLYNFFLWLIIRDKSYIFYTLYALTFGLLQADLTREFLDHGEQFANRRITCS